MWDSGSLQQVTMLARHMLANLRADVDCTSRTIQRTAVKPDMNIPENDMILPRSLSSRYSNEQREVVLSCARLSMETFRDRCLAAFETVAHQSLSLEYIGGPTDNQVETHLCRLYEKVFSQHVHSVLERVRERPTAAPTGLGNARNGFDMVSGL